MCSVDVFSINIGRNKLVVELHLNILRSLTESVFSCWIISFKFSGPQTYSKQLHKETNHSVYVIIYISLPAPRSRRNRPNFRCTTAAFPICATRPCRRSSKWAKHSTVRSRWIPACGRREVESPRFASATLSRWCCTTFCRRYWSTCCSSWLARGHCMGYDYGIQEYFMIIFEFIAASQNYSGKCTLQTLPWSTLFWTIGILRIQTLSDWRPRFNRMTSK